VWMTRQMATKQRFQCGRLNHRVAKFRISLKHRAWGTRAACMVSACQARSLSLASAPRFFFPFL